MARCPVFAGFGRRILRDGAGEVGMHLHAWNSPPDHKLTSDDLASKPYLIEYPAEVVRSKTAVMTRLLEDTFGVKMTSHRAGRWAFDGVYARALIELGYEADCSVTPGISWRFVAGNPNGSGGSDYSAAPSEPYYVDPAEPRLPGVSRLLEVPMTILPNRLSPGVKRLWEKFGNRSLARGVLNRLAPAHSWLRPNGRNRASLIETLHDTLAQGRGHIEMMLHSSELMPGGSPTFRSAESIEVLYRDMRALFALASINCEPRTLTEFARDCAASRSTARPTANSLLRTAV
jgi:hypothetical protein